MKLKNIIVATLLLLSFVIVVNGQAPQTTKPEPIKVSKEQSDTINAALDALQRLDKEAEILKSKLQVAVVTALAKAGKDPDKFQLTPDGKGGYIIEEIPPKAETKKP